MKKILSTIIAVTLVAVNATAISAEKITGLQYVEETGEVIPITEKAETVGTRYERVYNYMQEHSDDVINREKSLEESINDLTALGILQGYPDGEIHIENKITRAEMAAFIVRIMYGINYSESDVLNKLEIKVDFEDLSDKHWAYTELATLSNENLAYRIIEGYEDNTIRPENNITYLEAGTMLLRMLNYNELIDEKGGYPDGVKYWADELALFERTKAKEDLNAPATRGDIIIMLSTALDTKVSDSLDENCIRTENMQIGPLTMRQIRDMNEIK